MTLKPPKRLMGSPQLAKASVILISAALGALVSLSANLYAEKTPPDSPESTELPLAEMNEFAQVYGRVKQDYVEPVEDKKMLRAAINGLLSGLDPHSAYLDAEAFKSLNEQTSGEFGGIGLEVGMEEDLVRVTAPIDGTPAYLAGVKSGDYIIKIDDKPVKGNTLNDAVKQMRGKPGSIVTLTIIRGQHPKPLVIPVKRAIIKAVSVRSKLLETDYGYLRLAQFQERSAEDMAQAFGTLYQQNKAPLKGLILDLRDDPGGLLTSAVSVSSLFLPEKTLVVYTNGRAEGARAKFFTSPALPVFRNATSTKPIQAKNDRLRLLNDARSVPLVVLINGGSASASEIVAGALQDHKRAIIVGTASFGKGSVQTLLAVSNQTAIKLTTAHYFTPNGRSIQAAGIVPDILVEEATLSNPSANRQTLRIREADLNRHLDNPTLKPVLVPAAPTEEPAAPAKEDPGIAGWGAIAWQQDYQLNQALHILKVQQIIASKQK